MDIYIYIERERERERIYMYIYCVFFVASFFLFLYFTKKTQEHKNSTTFFYVLTFTIRDLRLERKRSRREL
jgi:phage-related protein